MAAPPAPHVVAVLGRARDLGRAAIEAAFEADPRRSRPTVRAYAWLTDGLVREVLHVATTHLHPLSAPTASERLAVLAVGGYGRAEMAPYSDVDLLFLTPWKTTPWAESVVETMLYIFWDLNLKVGHATRTVKDCLRLAREDYTIRTALLEHRYLAGDAALAAELKQEAADRAVPQHRRRIHRGQAGRARRAAPPAGRPALCGRAQREGGQGRAARPADAVLDRQIPARRRRICACWSAAACSPRRNTQTFRDAEDFLLAVRCHLHLIAGRAMDQLTFDLQVEVAERMGYADNGGRRAVEHFMQDYFRHATRVGELTRIFLTDAGGAPCQDRAARWSACSAAARPCASPT